MLQLPTTSRSSQMRILPTYHPSFAQLLHWLVSVQVSQTADRLAMLQIQWLQHPMLLIWTLLIDRIPTKLWYLTLLKCQLLMLYIGAISQRSRGMNENWVWGHRSPQLRSVSNKGLTVLVELSGHSLLYICGWRTVDITSRSVIYTKLDCITHRVFIYNLLSCWVDYVEYLLLSIQSE
jgi:hypothetical protein